MSELGPIQSPRRRGDEPFHDDGHQLHFKLLGFWQWSASDLVSNVTRGALAEYLVAQALGVAEDAVREEWAPYDLTAPDGTRVEVKSAAYLQSWHQDRLSPITFRVPKTLAWDKQTNRQSQATQRHADVYVFALLGHRDKNTLDPLDVSQWEFYVVPTRLLDNRKRSQHSITLASLRKLPGPSVGFSGLRHAVEQAGRTQATPARSG
ncbi:MAG: hypothetical protein JXB62_11020 [Pirellulales bacterium]|nr:hypothetical protein [Pirellulales bacterium]